MTDSGAEYESGMKRDVEALGAEAFTQYLREKQNVHKAEVVDSTTVSAVEKRECTDDTKVFSGARSRGWVVGMVCPDDHGNTYVFVWDGDSR